jgi:4'-phosphopantetheinyl transferase
MNDAMDAYWLEQTEADVPAENQWLSPKERMRLAEFRFAKRRTDWRLGRWTAKRALSSYLNLPGDPRSLEEIEIRTAPSGAPEVFLFNQKAAVSISLSHRAGIALCVVGLSRSTIGCDLEMVEPRDDAFVGDFFTANERILVEGTRAEERPLLVTLLWSAKESALKALHVGLRLDTACIDVSLIDAASGQCGENFGQNSMVVSRLAASAGWSALHVRHDGTQVFSGWWRHADHMVRTVIFNPLRSGSI